ncbi:MAG: ribonuclease HI [Spirochaetia bacterium]|nr:ribonuclease HI [Spirochaetia bacterium]
MQETITIYTDGGCSGNPGVGGWAYVIQGNPPITGSGSDPFTTNNKMELSAVIYALEYVLLNYSGSVNVELITDSQYVKQGISVWIHNWKKNGWKTASKSPVKNKELWQTLDAISRELNVTWKWVKGHSGVELNELCDTLVQQEMALLQ